MGKNRVVAQKTIISTRKGYEDTALAYFNDEHVKHNELDKPSRIIR